MTEKLVCHSLFFVSASMQFAEDVICLYYKIYGKEPVPCDMDKDTAVSRRGGSGDFRGGLPVLCHFSAVLLDCGDASARLCAETPE